MTWTNPIDRLPQVPKDWGNHIIYGGGIGVALILARVPALWATIIVLALGAAKKIVDYLKEGESAWICLGKTFVGAIWPASVAVVLLFGGCAIDSPNSHFQAVTGCLQLPQHATSNSSVPSPADILPRPAR